MSACLPPNACWDFSLSAKMISTYFNCHNYTFPWNDMEEGDTNAIWAMTVLPLKSIVKLFPSPTGFRNFTFLSVHQAMPFLFKGILSLLSILRNVNESRRRKRSQCKPFLIPEFRCIQETSLHQFQRQCCAKSSSYSQTQGGGERGVALQDAYFDQTDNTKHRIFKRHTNLFLSKLLSQIYQFSTRQIPALWYHRSLSFQSPLDCKYEGWGGELLNILTA